MLTAKAHFPTVRMRRLRVNPQLRGLIRQTQLSVNDFILPLFIHHNPSMHNPVVSMPGVYQLGINHLMQEIDEIVSLNIPGVILFGIPNNKDPHGSASYDAGGIIQQAIIAIKEKAADLLVIADACFCEYTDHGHCGVITERNGKKEVHNDATLELLAKQAISYAQAGADIVAPSGMMDGMVQAIRKGLDACGLEQTLILSYAAKYASALYGPFREAAEGAPKFGDRKTYQMDPANADEALRETALDLAEGADMLMVKPAHAYLDIIHRVKQAHPGVPLGAYQVSGEYAMLKAAAEKGWIDEKKTALEILTAIKRAGADFILTYYAKEAARWLAS